MNSAGEQLLSAQQQFINYLQEAHRATATIVAYSKDIEQLMSFLSDMGKKNLGQI